MKSETRSWYPFQRYYNARRDSNAKSSKLLWVVTFPHIVTIDATGRTSLKVEGIKGTSCVALTEDLLNELGAVVNEKKTSEYYQQTVSATSPVHSK